MAEKLFCKTCKNERIFKMNIYIYMFKSFIYTIHSNKLNLKKRKPNWYYFLLSNSSSLKS